MSEPVDPGQDKNSQVGDVAEEPKPKTPEELLEDKKKLMQEDSDRFIDAAEVIMAVKVLPDKGNQLAVMFNPQGYSRSQLLIVKGEVEAHVDLEVQHRMMKAQMDARKGNRIIHPPKGGIMGFARHGRKR